MSEEEIINYLEKVSKEKTIMPLDNYIQGLLDLYNKEKEKNKLITNDIENFKCQAYMLGRADENEAMKGVIQRHYISKDKIKEHIDLVREEKEHYIDLIDDYNAQICDEIIEALQNLLEE